MRCFGRTRWAPKNIHLLASVAFFFLVIFNKAEYKVSYLDWSLGAIIVFVVLSFVVLRGRVARRELLYLLLPVVWLVYGLLLTPFAYDTSHHFYALTKVFSLTLISQFVVASAFSAQNQLTTIIKLTAATWVFVSLLFMVMWGLGLYQYDGDFAGLYDNRNEFAVQTVVLVAFVLFLVRSQLFLFVIAATALLLVLASGSLKGLFSLILIFAYPWFLTGSALVRIGVVVSGIAVAGSIYFCVPEFQSRLDRFVLAFHEFEALRVGESAFLRPWLIIEGGKLIQDNPMFGVGIDNARFFLIPPIDHFVERGVGMYTHNNYMEMALNIGLIGSAVFYAPVLYVFFKVKPAHRYYRAIKTWSVLYLTLGVVMVQYDNFISIVLYCAIIFVYFYYKGYVEYDTPSLSGFNVKKNRPYESTFQYNKIPE